MNNCENWVCRGLTTKRGEGYCYRLAETRDQVLSNNTGEDLSDSTKAGPYWQRTRLETRVKEAKLKAEQDGCANSFLDTQLVEVVREKEDRGHII